MTSYTFVFLFYATMITLVILYIRACNRRDQKRYQQFLQQRKIAVLEDTVERWKKYVPLKEWQK